MNVTFREMFSLDRNAEMGGTRLIFWPSCESLVSPPKTITVLESDLVATWCKLHKVPLDQRFSYAGVPGPTFFALS